MVVDRPTKIAHFVPADTIVINFSVVYVFRNVFVIHALPFEILSDHDSKFFWMNFGPQSSRYVEPKLN